MPKVLVVSILLTMFALFSWNYQEFFGPDAVYYFARKLDGFDSVVSAFLSLDDRGQYRPMGLVLFSYLFFPLVGFDLTGHHLIPLLFHAANTILVYMLARRIMSSEVAAMGAAFFFSLHRINFFVTYSITFIPDFTTQFFLLSAFLLYLSRDRSRFHYAASIILWILALFCKETAVVFPAILNAYGWVSLKSGLRALKLFKATLPFWAIGIGYLVLFLSLNEWAFYSQDPYQPYRLGFSPAVLLSKVKYFWWSLNLPQGSRVTRLVGTTLGIETVPLPRAYPYHTTFAAMLLLPFAAVFLGFLAVRLWRHDRIVVFALCQFLLALAPVVPLQGRVMQHYLYFSLFGLSLMFGAFVQHLFSNGNRIFLPLFVVVFLFSTGSGVVNNKHSSWPVNASRTSAKLLSRFESALADLSDCRRPLVIARTGQKDFVWYSDGGNLFRVFGPCRNPEIYFEDLGDQSANVAGLKIEFDVNSESR
ncbi:MAG: glycosyltransferase family 39 protein [Acidobacteria bacterium]|nr:glycosyltransferase family 39 protein [Acidobacteriota bacterium]